MTNEQPSATQRLFIAIPLTPDVRERVARIANGLAEEVEGVRWVPSQNLHVTLRFIGECGASKIPDLVAWMKKAAAHLPLSLLVGGAGGFPSQASARVIWVGAEDRTGDIVKVYNVVDKGVQKCGFGREGRKYRPHITVGRARRRPVRLPGELIKGLAGDEATLEVRDLVLYRSDLKSTGVEYTEIARVGTPADCE